MYKHYEDGIFRRCILENEMQNVTFQCHSTVQCGHFVPQKTAAKTFQVVFFWPTLFSDVKFFIASCDSCQRLGNISKRDEMS